MHFPSILYIGLLGLLSPSSGPQGLVTARSVFNAGPDVSLKARDHLSARGSDLEFEDKPKIKLSDITKDIQLSGPDPNDSGDDYDPEDPDSDEETQAKAKAEVYRAQTRSIPETVLLKVHRRMDWLQNEVYAYEGIEGEDIAPEFKALVVDKHKDDVVGFLLKYIEGATNARQADKDLCQGKLEALHQHEIVHNDPNMGNFLIKGNKAWLIDFEDAFFTKDAAAFNEDNNLFTMSFENNWGRRT